MTDDRSGQQGVRGERDHHRANVEGDFVVTAVAAGLDEDAIPEFVGDDFRPGLVEVDDPVSRQPGLLILSELPNQTRSSIGG